MHKMFENSTGNNAYMFLKDYGVEKRSTNYHKYGACQHIYFAC